METSNFIRQTLNEITPTILQGRIDLTENDEIAIFAALKKQAVQLFVRSKLNEATEINSFIESKPRFLIWPKNGGFSYMQKYCCNPIAAKKVIIFSSEKDFFGIEQLNEGINKIMKRRKNAEENEKH